MERNLSFDGVIRQVRATFAALALRPQARSLSVPHIVRVEGDEAYRRDFDRLWRDIKTHSAHDNLDAYLGSMREQFKRMSKSRAVVDIGDARLRILSRRVASKEASQGFQP